MDMIPTCKKIYLCDFNLHPLTVLNGVDTNSVKYSCHVKDYDELTFDVDEYIIINGKKVKSLGYDMLLPYMTVYLEDLGMFQMQNPKTSNDGNSEKKSITAYSLEKEFEDTKVIKLEQNYRSTSTILDAANAVIKNNVGRKAKSLWTENGEGEKIQFRQFDTAYDEAEYIVGDIRERVDNGKAAYCDHAVLYRTNAQSRLFEEKMITANIPYKIVGGVNFYARKEIKDLLAYLKTIDNGKDDLAVRRIINVPKRGIGLTTVNRITEAAQQRGISFYEALCSADLVPGLGRSISKLESFAAMIEYFRKEAEHLSITELMEEILTETGYVEELKAEGEEEAEARLQNIDEFLNKIAAYEESCEEELPTLSGFLEEVALVADIDSLDEESDYVVLMTLHSAKGLEFPHVFLCALNEGIFPSKKTSTIEGMEEERRLAFVAMSRAMKSLFLSESHGKNFDGSTRYPSRFILDIDQKFLEYVKKPEDTLIAETKNYIHYSNRYLDGYVAEQTFQVGDKIIHNVFGQGRIKSILSDRNAYMIKFEQIETPRIISFRVPIKRA